MAHINFLSHLKLCQGVSSRSVSASVSTAIVSDGRQTCVQLAGLAQKLGDTQNMHNEIQIDCCWGFLGARSAARAMTSPQHTRLWAVVASRKARPVPRARGTRCPGHQNAAAVSEAPLMTRQQHQQLSQSSRDSLVCVNHTIVYTIV